MVTNMATHSPSTLSHLAATPSRGCRHPPTGGGEGRRSGGEGRQHSHFRRYAGYDYSRGASLFATVATEPRQALLGSVRDGAMVLSDYGRIVEEELLAAARHCPAIALFSRMVMPDHVHFRFRLAPETPEPLRAVGAFVGRFKQLSQWRIAQAGGPAAIWGKGYHDHLCLSRQMQEAIDRYITNNPLKWWLMRGDSSLMHVREPLAEKWLPQDAFWRGVGRFEPKAGMVPVALRISRKIPASQMPAVVETCLKGARRGYCYISTFFSPGEHEVFRAVAERTSAPMVHLRPFSIHWAYRPTGLEPGLFAAGRFMALARMEATGAPATRPDMLWLNRCAVDIALALGGKAVYVQPGPVYVQPR